MYDQDEQASRKPGDRLIESAMLGRRTVTLSAHSEGVTLMELRAIVAATESYPDDSMVQVFGVALCEDDVGFGDHWISGVKVTDLTAAEQEGRGELTQQFWPWACGQ